MTADLFHLTKRLTATEAGAVPWLWQPPLALLAHGRPSLSRASRPRPAAASATCAEDWPRCPTPEYIPDGRILGHGLTLGPIAHRFEVPAATG